VVKRAGLEDAELTQPPAPLEDNSKSFCPRCDMQFIVESGTCIDCGGIELQPLPADARASGIPDVVKLPDT